MALKHRQTLDLMQIVAAGGSVRFDASARTTADLMQIAASAAKGGARVYFAGMGNRIAADLMQIASAGKGAVTFED